MVRRARAQGRLTRQRAGLALALVGAGLAAAPAPGCRREPRSTPGARLSWTLSPDPPRVGPAVIALVVTDPASGPVRGAKLRIEGHMAHPGMVPVVAEVTEQVPGRYAARLAFSMAGDWVLRARAEWEGGGRLEEAIALRVAPPD